MQQNKQNNKLVDSYLQNAKDYLKLGNLQLAAKEYNEVIKRDPQNHDALINLANILMQSGNIEPAYKLYKNLVNLYPEDDRPYNSLGVIYFQRGDGQKALEHFEKAASLRPLSSYFLNLYSIYFKIKDYDKALDAIKKAHELDVSNVKILSQLVDLCYSHSYSESLAYIKKLYQLAPSFSLKIASELFIPSVYESQQEINEIRQKIEQNLTNIITELSTEGLNPDKYVKPAEKLYLAPFYLAYHNLNNKNIKAKLAELDLKLFPFLEYTASHIKNYRFDKTKKIKVGFPSSFFHKHPVSQCFHGLILELNKDERFDVSIFYYGEQMKLNKGKNEDEYLKKLSAEVKNYYEVEGDFITIRDFIASKKLDVIIYPEIGMYSGAAAYARLAPIQAVLTGHPDTTGIPNVDYYFSADDLEGRGAEDYYAEKLVRFKNLFVCFEKQEKPEKFKTKEELCIPLGKNIYYCPMKNQKIHPDFDFALKDILEKDDNAIILFPKDTGQNSEFVKGRISRNIGSKLSERIIYHEWADNITFLSYLHQADVILDTFYFGAGTTLYYIFAVDAPIVTLPSLLTASRPAYSLYKNMGIPDLIAKDKEHYVELAIKCAKNKEFAQSVSSKINSRKEIIYNNKSVVPELKEFIVNSLDKFS